MKLHVFVGLLLLTILTTLIYEEKLTNEWIKRKNIEIEQEASLLSLQITNLFTTSFSNLSTLASFFKAHPNTSEENFSIFAKEIKSHQPAIRAIEFADHKTQVIYVYPKQGNEVILEKPFILLEDKFRKEITQKAIQSRSMTIQDPFVLKQGGIGTVARIPIFRKDQFIGMTLGVYDIKDLMAFVLSKQKREMFSIQFSDQKGDVFYKTGELTFPASSAPINFGNSSWTFSLSWKKQPVPPIILRYGLIYIISGCFLFILLFLINKTWVYTDLLNQLVKVQTKDLQEVNQSLQKEISEKEKVTEQLSHSEKKLRAILSTTIDGVISFDNNLKISLWNAAAEKIYGYTQEEMIGASILKLVPERYKGLEKERWKEFKKTGFSPSIGKTMELLGLRENGQEVPIELSFSTSQVDGKYIATAIIRNIAKRKEHEQILLESEKNLHEEVDHLKKQLDEKIEMRNKMGVSKEISQVVKQIKLVAPTMMSVIIQGESGTGKEIIANMIHQSSGQKEQPFIALDCGAIPETLFESELFGHERGAFTGADRVKVGKFELAQGGTLFLDELTNLSFDSQGKLLRVIQERKYYRVGGKESKKLDVRIVVASNRVMSECVAQGQFREDLYHRLNQFSIALPTLKQRRDDIPFLINVFIKQANQELGKSVKAVCPDAMKQLMKYSWPGNIRELNNTIKRAVLLCDSDKIQMDLLALEDYTDGNDKQTSDVEKAISKIIKNKLSFQEASKINAESFDKKVILKVLERVDDKKNKAADVLGMNRKTLYTRLKKLGIER